MASLNQRNTITAWTKGVRRPLPGPGVVEPAVGSQPARHAAKGLEGHVEGGTGDHVGSCLVEVSWSKPTLPGQVPTPVLRHAPRPHQSHVPLW